MLTPRGRGIMPPQSRGMAGAAISMRPEFCKRDAAETV